jgi:hypothetical protein
MFIDARENEIVVYKPEVLNTHFFVGECYEVK